MKSENRHFALAVALLAWFGIVLQGYLSLRLSVGNGKSILAALEVFLSYFTVLTNLLVCVSLTWMLAAPQTRAGKFFSRAAFTTGLAASIAFVGLSYHFLLRNTWNPQGLQLLADYLLHYLVPVVYVLYWWFSAPKAPLRWMHPLIWSLYPTLYLGFALIRGDLVESYPYPFIDVAAIGYQRTLFNSLGLLVVFIALGYLFVFLARARAQRG